MGLDEKVLFFVPKDFEDVVECPLGDMATEICNRVNEILEARGVTAFVLAHTTKADTSEQRIMDAIYNSEAKALAKRKARR